MLQKSWIDIKDKVESVEGRLVPGQEKFLFDKVKETSEDATILEIGSFLGRSTVAMGYACVGTNRKIYCIDTWQDIGGSIYKGPKNFFSMWKKNITIHGLVDYVIPLSGRSDVILSQWKKFANNIQVDFVFIDGSHEYVDVLKDFILTYPLMKVGGWMAFHDICATFPGPTDVWNNIAKYILNEHQQLSTIMCGQKL